MRASCSRQGVRRKANLEPAGVSARLALRLPLKLLGALSSEQAVPQVQTHTRARIRSHSLVSAFAQTLKRSSREVHTTDLLLDRFGEHPRLHRLDKHSAHP